MGPEGDTGAAEEYVAVLGDAAPLPVRRALHQALFHLLCRTQP